MRTLKEYVNEGLLAGQSSTLTVGDKINDQFEKIKSLVVDPNKYEKTKSRSYTFIHVNNVEDILSFVGLNKQTSLNVTIQKKEEYVGWDSYENYWYFDITIADGDNIKFKKPARGVSFPKFLQKYVAPHFKDIESFKKLIEDKI